MPGFNGTGPFRSSTPNRPGRGFWRRKFSWLEKSPEQYPENSERKFPVFGVGRGGFPRGGGLGRCFGSGRGRNGWKR